MIRIVLAFVLAMLIAEPSLAQSCAPFEAVEAGLREDGKEPVRRGFRDENSVYEWWENADGDFTVLKRTPDGSLCVMTSGTYSHIPPAPPEGDQM